MQQQPQGNPPQGYPQYPQQQPPYYQPQYAPTPPPRKKGKTWLIVGIIAAILVFACIGAGAIASHGTANNPSVVSNTNTNTQKQDTGQATAKHFTVGQIVKDGDWEVTINSVKTNLGQDYDTPKSGNVFLLIDVTLKNISNQQQPVSSLVMFTLRDTTGLEYNETIVTFAGSAPNGKAEAGQQIRGILPYEVPTAQHAFTLSFIGHLTDQQQTVFDIKY